MFVCLFVCYFAVSFATHIDACIIIVIDCMQGLVCAIAIANGRHQDPVATNFYVRSFLQRHPQLTELKSANVGYHRAKQATAEVRDAVFNKLQVRNTS